MAMKRLPRIPRLRTLLLFLLLGAAANVAVAWGCAWRCAEWKWSYTVPGGPDHRMRADEFMRLAVVSAGVTPVQSEVRGQDLSCWGARNVTTYSPIIDSKSGNRISLSIRWSGWPCLSMRFETWFETPRRYTHALWPREYVGGRNARKFEAIPLLPVPGGFAVNTLFYAAILWLLFATAFAVRRRRRIKRGLCPACAYPVGTSDVCTECGKPVAARSVEPVA